MFYFFSSIIIPRSKTLSEIQSYYDISKRGAKSPDYSVAEATYRSERLTELNNAYIIREQNHMELNLLPYSQYDLINFQCDIAYNPPKTNPADSRIVSGLVRQKDKTLVSVIQDMNFQPKCESYDKQNKLLINVCQIFTAKLKKTLLQINFKDQLENISHLLVSRGNVFVNVQKQEKWQVKKIRTGFNSKAVGNFKNQKISWKTIYEKEYDYCNIDVIPSTSVFPLNIRGEGMKDQARTYTVRHYPISQLAARFKDNPRWESVAKAPSMTIPTILNGVWGDYYLKLPITDYGELITMESEVFNEFQEWVNGVQMHPVQEENGLITGYPLSEVSPTASYTLCKGDYDRIPFFFFSKSNPDANFVKEEEINEVMRLMVLMLRQKTQPSIGNNTDRVLQSNIWDPNMIISDIKAGDISILKPNEGISNAEFSFYKLLVDSLGDSSISTILEGADPGDTTNLQYTERKKENLKKIGLSLDRVMDLLRQIYWNILDNEISYLSQKTKQYQEDGSFIEAYQSFSIDDSIDGKNGTIKVQLMDDTSNVDPYAQAQQEANDGGMHRTYYAKPKDLMDIYKRMRDQINIEVVAQPEGEQMSLLTILLNLLTQYSNLKGGDTRKINFDYIETIIGQNSGFDQDKIFLDQVPPAPPVQPGEVNPTDVPGGGKVLPQNMNPRPGIKV